MISNVNEELIYECIEETRDIRLGVAESYA
jgi:hypothetical protein